MIVNYFNNDSCNLHIGLSRSCVIQHLTFSASNEYIHCPPFPAFPTSLMKIWQTQWTSKCPFLSNFADYNMVDACSKQAPPGWALVKHKYFTINSGMKSWIIHPKLLFWFPHSRRLILDSRFWILCLRLIWQMQWTSTTCLKAQCRIIKLSCARSTFLQMRPNVVKLCRVCTTLFYTNSSPMRPTIYATLNESQLLIVDTCLRKTILFKVMK